MDNMKNNLTVRDYMKIIEVLEKTSNDLISEALKKGEDFPTEADELQELIEKVKNIET